MATGDHHQDFMTFASKVTSILSTYTQQELRSFHRIARRAFPAISPVVRSLIDVVKEPRWNLKDPEYLIRKSKSVPLFETEKREEHLFDLLRSKKLFPTNAELAEFAGRILQGMTKKRFNKMSRSDIAGRIIEYLETLNAGKRRRLEDSMRGAMVAATANGDKDRKSFFSQWEEIIKGII